MVEWARQGRQGAEQRQRKGKVSSFTSLLFPFLSCQGLRQVYLHLPFHSLSLLAVLRLSSIFLVFSFPSLSFCFACSLILFTFLSFFLSLIPITFIFFPLLLFLLSPSLYCHSLSLSFLFYHRAFSFLALAFLLSFSFPSLFLFFLFLLFISPLTSLLLDLYSSSLLPLPSSQPVRTDITPQPHP